MNQHVDDGASITLYPTANSWYMGANVPGKARAFLPYVAGVDTYRATCDEVVDRDYLGFRLSGPAGSECNDGVIRRLQVDVAKVLEFMEELELPPMEQMSVGDARAFMAITESRVLPDQPWAKPSMDPSPVPPATCRTACTARDAGPSPVGRLLPRRWLGPRQPGLRRPALRDLCVRSDAVIVSVDYRHAPEARFPTAADDAFAAVQWIAAHAEELGGLGTLLVALSLTTLTSMADGSSILQKSVLSHFN